MTRRVQVILPDEERERFHEVARREGMSLSRWMRPAARERLERTRRSLVPRLPGQPQSTPSSCGSPQRGSRGRPPRARAAA